MDSYVESEPLDVVAEIMRLQQNMGFPDRPRLNAFGAQIQFDQRLRLPSLITWVFNITLTSVQRAPLIETLLHSLVLARSQLSRLSPGRPLFFLKTLTIPPILLNCQRFTF